MARRIGAPPAKPSSLSSLKSQAATKLPRNTPGIRPRSKFSGLSEANSVRVSTSAEGPVKLSAWIGCGSKLAAEMA
jgi:hypothetical protein